MATIRLMMGGKVSHEFMLLTEIGEDTIAICPTCGYSANMEAADVKVNNAEGEVSELTKVHTPDCKTIEDVCAFLKADVTSSMKAVVYQRNADDSYVIAFVRGDLEVNETKLRNHLKCEIHPAVVTEESGITAGFIGPVNAPKNVTLVFDASLEGISALVCGANETDYHYTGLNIARDCGDVQFVDVAKIYDGAICPVCGQPHITIKKGIEIGNIFKLGTKYTESMDMTYLDADGVAKHPIMGCYGIGVGRLCASICQESHDNFGPIWPMSIAPWQVEVCNLRSDDETVNSTAAKLYEDLKAAGVEVLYDDRNIRPGAMFADADLFGIPVRVVVSPKTCEKGVFEVSFRDKSWKGELPMEGAALEIRRIVDEHLALYK